MIFPSKLSRKECILRCMEQSSGWCSGQEIADTLGISRAAVGKHVAVLRSEGHIIESASKKGYRLIMQADTIRPEDIREALQTRCFGQRYIDILPETTSTSNELVAQALLGAEEGTIVVAEKQTHGKGRKGHDWFSAPRALQFSLLLRPKSLIAHDFFMQAAALSVAQAVADITSLTAQVKGPNDVFIGGRKVAGVLIETGFRSDELEWVVVGIGCNVNTMPEEFPQELRHKVTSLYDAGGNYIPRARLLAAILARLEGWYDILLQGTTLPLRQAWEDWHIG